MTGRPILGGSYHRRCRFSIGTNDPGREKKLKVGGAMTDNTGKRIEKSAPNSFPLLFLEKWRPNRPPFFLGLTALHQFRYISNLDISTAIQLKKDRFGEKKESRTGKNKPECPLPLRQWKKIQALLPQQARITPAR
jgi:hypothetical protein